MDAQIEIPDEWARWEVEPIDSTGRRSVEELMLSKGRLSAQFVAKKLLQREPGSRLRTRLLTAALRGGLGLTNRHEYEDLFGNIYTEDCELTFEAFFPDMGEGSQRGREELKRYMDSFDDAYSSMVFQPRAIVDPGGDRFAGAIEATAVGRTTGIAINQAFGVVYRFAEGRVCEQQVFRDWPTTIERLKQQTGAG